MTLDAGTNVVQMAFPVMNIALDRTPTMLMFLEEMETNRRHVHDPPVPGTADARFRTGESTERHEWSLGYKWLRQK